MIGVWRAKRGHSGCGGAGGGPAGRSQRRGPGAASPGLPLESLGSGGVIRPREHAARLPRVQTGVRRLSQHELHVLPQPRRDNHDGGRGQGRGRGGEFYQLVITPTHRKSAILTTIRTQ